LDSLVIPFCAILDHMSKVVHSDPEILSGTPVFVGTRVPVKNLFDYLKSGESIDGFIDDFPSVTQIQVLDFLKELQAQATKGRQAA